MKRCFNILLSLFVAMLVLTSCEHKDLCYHHPHTARVRIDVDWSQYSKPTPSGMSVHVYKTDGSHVLQSLTNTITHTYVNLDAGLYHSIVFNQSPSEYGSVTFKDLDNYNRASVVTNKYVSRWYVARRGGSDEVAEQPEWIGADKQELMEVTEEMVEATSGYMTHESKGDQRDYVIATHYPLNIIHTLNVKVHIKGIKNLRSARASLDGLSEGYIFRYEHPSTALVTQLLESWRLSTDKSTNDAEGRPVDGYITSQITFFGMPTGHLGLPEENYFYLSLLLVDGKTQVDAPFYVGDRITRDPVKENTWNLILTLEDPLPDVAPGESVGAGFGAFVDEWGEEENIEVGI